jgi:hypothetical protein
MKIKINGVSIEKPLEVQFNEAVEKAYNEINSKNRAVRRSKPIKKVLGFLSFVIPLGLTSVAHAQTLSNNPTDNRGFVSQLFDFSQVFNNVMYVLSGNTGKYMKDQIGIGDSGPRENSVIWHMNNWFQNTLLNTQDFFDNVEVISIFNAIWTICMSFVLIIIGKKGFDMVKANVLGSTTIGASQLIIRLLASVVMTFLSLDIMQLGIHGSNLVIKTLFKAIETHLVPYSVLEHTNSLGLIFWFIGFAFMTIIISVQYWVRQITIAILGVLTPVANLSWVVDGGAMLGTVIREFVTLIVTPVIHGVVLVIGSVFIREVTTMTGNVWIDGFNSIMIGFSTMFLMIVTPTFLRKFTTGTVNPFTMAWNLGKGMYGNTLKLAKLIKQ